MKKALSPAKPLFTTKEYNAIVKDLVFINENAHRALRPETQKHLVRFIHTGASNLRRELDVRTKSKRQFESAIFPGLTLDVSLLLRTMRTKQNASARGYLAWRNPENDRVVTATIEVNYNDSTHCGSDTGYMNDGSVTLTLEGALVTSNVKESSSLYIDIIKEQTREYFLCPFPKRLGKWSLLCEKKTERLFLPSGRTVFACADCCKLRPAATSKFWKEFEYQEVGSQSRACWARLNAKRHREYLREKAQNQAVAR